MLAAAGGVCLQLTPALPAGARGKRARGGLGTAWRLNPGIRPGEEDRRRPACLPVACTWHPQLT